MLVPVHRANTLAPVVIYLPSVTIVPVQLDFKAAIVKQVRMSCYCETGMQVM